MHKPTYEELEAQVARLTAERDRYRKIAIDDYANAPPDPANKHLHTTAAPVAPTPEAAAKVCQEKAAYFASLVDDGAYHDDEAEGAATCAAAIRQLKGKE